MTSSNFQISVAPMMDWTDRHCRYFHRALSRHVRLYTEMVVADAIIHGPTERLLQFDPVEHPVALQIGGSDPDKVRKASAVGTTFGYDEINLNVGCPSDRVQSGRFGACLMSDPELVADLFVAMQDGAADAGEGAPDITIKCRLGIDDQDLDRTLPNFVETIAGAGCQTVIIHARKAWLQGLSPKENRTVPPIDYGRVQRIKQQFPSLNILVNGEIATVEQGLGVAEGLDGFMMGRAAYNDPWSLTAIDAVYGDQSPATDRDDIAERMINYLTRIENEDRSAKALIRHMMGLYAGQPGARRWRRTLSEGLAAKMRPSEILQAGLDVMRRSEAA